jgi:hypothetical protein
MKTFKQAIQTLGRRARQAASIGVAGLGLAAVMSGPVSAQTHHSGERSDDFTGMPRNMTPLPIERCANGQIAVGSTCVNMPVTPPTQPQLPNICAAYRELGKRGLVMTGYYASYSDCPGFPNDGIGGGLE